MKVLAAIALIWLLFALIGSIFGVLGKVIWIAILLSIIVALWGYLKR